MKDIRQEVGSQQAKKRQNKRFWGIGVIACLFSILLSCSQPVTPLRVGTVTWTGYEPLYLAQELGYFKDKPVQIINYPSGTEVSRAHRNHELDVAALTLDEVLLSRETEPNIQAFLITDISNGGDVLIAKPRISNLKDLKGKRVGVETSALAAYLLARALEEAMLSVKDIKIIPLSGIEEYEQAYQDDIIDALITYEPARSKLLKAGGKVLFDSSQIPNEIVDVLAANQELLESRADAFEALAEGWFRVLDYLKQNSEDAIRRMALRQQVTPEEFRQALELIDIPSLTENQKLLSKADRSMQIGTESMRQIMLEQDLLQQVVDVETILTDSIVKKLP